MLIPSLIGGGEDSEAANRSEDRAPVKSTSMAQFYYSKSPFSSDNLLSAHDDGFDMYSLQCDRNLLKKIDFSSFCGSTQKIFWSEKPHRIEQEKSRRIEQEKSRMGFSWAKIIDEIIYNCIYTY